MSVDGLIADTASLVAIASENPPGNEAGPARWLHDRVAGSADSVRVDDLDGGRANCVAEWSLGEGPTLVLCSHLDVVPADYPGAWTPEVRDGRLYGRGTCDAKGAIAAFVAAIERVVARPEGVSGTLVLAAVADEEGEALGARAFAATGIRADAAVIGEPTGNAVVLASRGVTRIAVDFAGSPAHSSDPSRGVNALYHAARFSLRIEELHARLVATGGGGSCSATLISGGTKVNVIPDRASVTIDRRLAPGESATTAVEEVEAILADLRAEDPTVDAGWRRGGIWVEPFELSRSHPLAAAALAAAGGREGPLFPGITDAPHLIAAGIPTLIVGPGEMAQAHTIDEWVALDSLAASVDVYEGIIRRLLAAGASPLRAAGGASAG